MPLYVVRWHYGPLPTTLLETLIVLTVAAYAWTLWTEKRLPSRTPYDIPLALWLVAGGLGVIAAPDHRAALGTYRAYFLEAVLMFYVAVDLLRSREDLKKLFMLGAVAAVIYAIGEITLWFWVAAHHRLQLGDAPAFLNNTPNADAMYLEPILAFSIGFVAFPWSRRMRIAAAAVLAFVLFAMILTLSRAGYLAMGVLAVVVVLSLGKGRLRWWTAAAIVVAAGSVLEIPFVNQRIAGISSSAALRESIFGQALRMLSERPVFGAGIDGYPIRVAPFHPSTQTIELYPHDIWLTTWSEVGLLGLFVLAFLLFTLIWRAGRAWPRADDVYRPILWGCFGAFILIFMHGFFDSPYWKNDLSVEFMMVAALVVVAIRDGLRLAAAGTRGAPGP